MVLLQLFLLNHSNKYFSPLSNLRRSTPVFKMTKSGAFDRWQAGSIRGGHPGRVLALP